LRLVDDFEHSKAYFVTIIALFFKPLNKDFFFEGRVDGRVSENMRGSKGFGFDPIFIPDKIKNKTFAELTTKEKNIISHRGIAWKKMIEFLKSN
jgi:XTP/dITP diphosphohydrolase